MDMSQVQFAPAVSDDVRLAQKMLIGGEWVGALSGRTLPVYDPADGRMIVEVPEVWVNCYQAADSALPFGGTKESGWGRETCRETLEEYLETKTVVVSL
jgi:acyl-CoA reductase-like NAD-dependent aldehyde dehydrogenase